MSLLRARRVRCPMRTSGLCFEGELPLILKRFVALVLVVAQVTLGIPVDAAADTTPPSPPRVAVNRTVPDVDPVPLVPQFSPWPTTEEIARARVFGAPIVAIGGEPSAEESKALAGALLAFHQGSGHGRFSRLESFVATYPQSPYRASVFLNLGQTYWRDGYFTRAFAALDQAWAAAKQETSPMGRAVGDAAIGQLLDVNSAYGRHGAIDDLLAEVEGRDLSGPAVEQVVRARQVARQLRDHHENAVPSGPSAVWRIQVHVQGPGRSHPAFKQFRASHAGTTLARMDDLARMVGVDLKPAYRLSDAPVPIPSLAHFKGGHFTAVVGENATHYKLDDVILGGEYWVTKEALSDDSSGYFLISGEIGPGWRAATREELAKQRGKCAGLVAEPNPPCEPGGGCSPPPKPGMATYNFAKMRASLQLQDVPLGYDPPRGPSVRFHLRYDHADLAQPPAFTFGNVGPKWTFNWLSYVEDDPLNASANVKIYMRSGAREPFDSFDATTSSFRTQRDTQAVLVRTGNNPIRYERRLPSGAVEVYAQPDGATSPRRVFLTQSIDPQGQTATYTYDASLRLLAVTDAIGQVTTLEYGHSSDPLKVTKVTDPFGRSARLEYDAAGRLIKITDVIGMASHFEYGSNNFIQALVTPYGKTTFSWSANPWGPFRWVEAQDPLGGRERVEYGHDDLTLPTSDPVVPPGFGPNSGLNAIVSFYWDKRAMALYPGDYTKAEQTKWMFGWIHPANLAGNWTAIPHSVKKPLEGRVWYAYGGSLGGPGYDSVGPMSKPTKIGRVLDDGTSQIHRMEWNGRGHITRYADPVGRETAFQYAPDGIDLLNVKQKNGGNYDLLLSATYNTKHQPLTITDAAGKTTNLTYRTTSELETIVTPAVGSQTAAERTTTLEYFLDSGSPGAAQLKRITGPAIAAGAPIVDLTYDGYGRPRTVTDVAESQTITLDYDGLDRTTKVTYPDNTFEEAKYNRLDAEQTRDRQGRWTHVLHDALGRPTTVRDPLGRETRVQYCVCGGPEKLIDGNGNATTWTRDLLGRTTRETRADNTHVDYVYENTTSRLKQVTDAKSQITNIQYFVDDALKQVSFANAQNATPTVSFAYDGAYPRMLTRTDGTGTTTYAYNPIAIPPALGSGQLASIDGPVANDTITYTYDEVGRVKQEAIDGVASTAVFDALGRVTQLTNALGSFTYNYVGITQRLSQVTYPNGQTTELSYLPASQEARLQEIHHKKPSGATLSRFAYTYEASGNIKTWTQQADGNPAKVYDLAYDSADQLVSATLKTTDPTPTLLKRYVYGYDKGDNRTSEQIDDVVTQSAHNNMNQLTSQAPGGALRFTGSLNEPATVAVAAKPANVSADNKFDGSAAVGSGATVIEVKATDPAGNVRTNNYQVSQSGATKTLTYDANGNLTSDGTRTYEWDALDQLIAINQGTHRTEFTYDGEGRRIKIVEKENGATVADRRFVWSGTDIAEERDAAGNVIKRFLGEGVQEAGSSYFLTTDHLGSVREMTDGTGAVRARYDIDPYGRRTKLAGDRDADYGFAGMIAHPPTGVSLANYRAYEPTDGRWLSGDPIGIDGGVNLYAYVGGNPIVFVDPLGLERVASAFAGFGDALLGNAYGMTQSPLQTVLVVLGIVEPENPGRRVRGWLGINNVEECSFDYLLSNLIGNITFVVATAGAGGGAPRAGRPPKPGDPGFIGPLEPFEMHHSDPKFMGGAPNQPLSRLPRSWHRSLHAAMRSFLRLRTDAAGNHMCHTSRNSGARIQRNFSRNELLEALRDFYNGPGSEWPEVVDDFFNQHPTLR